MARATSAVVRIVSLRSTGLGLRGPADPDVPVTTHSLRQPGWLDELRGFASHPCEWFALVGEAVSSPRVSVRHPSALTGPGPTYERGFGRAAAILVRHGAWRSLGGRGVWVAGAAGSNPAPPIFPPGLRRRGFRRRAPPLAALARDCVV